MRRTPASVIVVLVSALALAGCSTGGSSDSAVGTSDMSEDAAVSEPATSGLADGSADAATDASARLVVTTGYVSLVADDPAAASDDAVGIVETAGGRVDGRTEQAPTEDDGGSASLELRIPAAKLTPTLAALKKLGDVQSVQLSSQDVTTESQDLDARITALSASVDRLLALLSQADDTAVLIQLETAISDRQGELDSLTAQRRYLADQVTMSAVSLQISSEAPVPAATPSTFWDAVVAGAATLGSVATALVLFLGFTLPWLAVIAVLLAIVWIVRRRRHRRAASPSAAADH